MEQHRTLTVDGRTVHYRDEGRNNKPTLVLLHGLLQNLDVWTSYVLSYMNRLRVITIDLPGHGLTDTFCDVHTTDFMARIVKEVLNACGVDRCVMIGHSLGGYVSLAFAEQYPYSLCGLGLINSHAMADNEAQRTAREEVCQRVHESRAAYVLDFVPSLFDASRRAALSKDIKDLTDQSLETSEASIIAAQRGMSRRPSRIALLQQIDVPVYFVYGKNDPRIPIEVAVTQTLLPRRAESVLLSDTAHMAFLEEREYLRPRLLNFVLNCY